MYPQNIIIVLITLVLFTACSQQDNNFENGMKAYSEANYVNAEKYFSIAYKKAKDERIKNVHDNGIKWLKIRSNAIDVMKPMAPLLAFSVDKWHIALGKNSPWVAYGYLNLAFFDLLNAHYEKAQLAIDKAFSIYKITKAPQNPDLVFWFSHIGKFYESKGMYLQAEAIYKRLLSIEEDVYDKDAYETVNSIVRLAAYYERITKYDGAEILYKKSIEIIENTMPNVKDKFIWAFMNLARCTSIAGNFDYANKIYKRVIDMSKHDSSHSEAKEINTTVAWFYYNHGRFAEAESLFDEILSKESKVVNSKDKKEELANTLHNSVIFYQNSGQYKKALSSAEELFNIHREKLGINSIEAAHDLIHLAAIENGLGNNNKAQALTYWALTILETIASYDPVKVTDNLNQIALLFCKFQNGKMAYDLYQESCNIASDFEKAQKNSWHAISQGAKCYSAMASYCYDYGLLPQAEDCYKQAIAYDQSIHGIDSLDIVDNLFRLANCYYTDKKTKEANIVFNQVKNIIEKNIGKNHPWFIRAEANFDFNALNQLKPLETNYPDMCSICYLETANKCFASSANNKAYLYAHQTIALKDKFGPNCDKEKLEAKALIAKIAGIQNNWAKAELITKESLSHGDHCLEVYDFQALDLLSKLGKILGESYIHQGKTNYALPVLEKSLLLSMQVHGAKHSNTIEIQKLISLLKN
jgi:tetratricopeptide (TPR) repeat protein